MRVNLGEQKRARIEILPLIDIVFLLLVFFIYAMLSMAVHRGIPVNLPIAASAGIEKESLLSVTINENGKIFLDKTPVYLQELAYHIKIRARENDTAGILVFADKKVSCQVLVKVLDQIRISGISKISLQTNAERQP
ncbi:MAG TPA: biopolymer transporter ExbD [Desulfatiglandales bacterium]|nr:biopolymer transporter ExbD [Desulfatiglandales bacterium]